jgi:hypothetical protein
MKGVGYGFNHTRDSCRNSQLFVTRPIADNAFYNAETGIPVTTKHNNLTEYYTFIETNDAILSDNKALNLTLLSCVETL